MACVMESFYSVSDMHLGLMLWVGAEYLICALFSCNLSHLSHPVCHCDLFRIFGTWKIKYLKIPQCLIASLFHRYLHSCQPALLSFSPKISLSFLASVQSTEIVCMGNLACQMNPGHLLSAISRGHYSYLRWERKYWHEVVHRARSQILFFFPQ